MSVKALSAVFDDSAATDAAFTVLLALADWADHTGRCYPSYGQIAAKARVSRMTAIRAIEDLIRLGEVTRVIHGKAPTPDDEEAPETIRAQHRNLYQILLVKAKPQVVTAGDHQVAPQVVTPATAGSHTAPAQVVTSGDLHRRIRPSGRPSGEPSGPPPVVVDARTRFEQFWAAYPKKVGKGAAWRAWSSVHPTDALTATILHALTAQAGFLARDGGRYTPNPATWLSQERWTDEPPVVATPRESYALWSCPHVPPCPHRQACDAATILGRPHAAV